MSIVDQSVQPLFNASGSTVVRGTLVRSIAGVKQATTAQADNLSNLLGLVGPVQSLSVAAGGLMDVVSQGLAPVLLETGLSPQGGQLLYASAATAGRATNVAPASAVEIGVITDASSYAVDGTVQAIIFGSLSTAAAGIAEWDLDLVRYYFLDNDNGDDANVGYIDAAAGATFTAVQSAAVAIKTAEQLRNIMPRFGSARSVVVLIKPRSDAGNYLNKAGASDFLDMGYVGYTYIAFRGSDLTNSANDKVDLGGVIPAGGSGPNADGSWTVSAQVSTLVTVAAGALPAEDTMAGWKVRYAGNVTGALRTVGNMACDRVDATNFNVSTTAGGTAANGDQFFFQQPGVKFTAVRKGLIGNEVTNFNGSPERMAMLMAGIEFTGATDLVLTGALNFTFLRFDGAVDIENGEFRHPLTYESESGFIVTQCGLDARADYDGRSHTGTMQACAWHSNVTWVDGSSVDVGVGSISTTAVVEYFDSMVAYGATAATSGRTLIGAFNNSAKSFVCRAGISLRGFAGTLANIDLDGASAGIAYDGKCLTFVRNVTGALAAGDVLNVVNGEGCEIQLEPGNTATPGGGDAQVALFALDKTFAEAATQDYMDSKGNRVFQAGGVAAKRYTVDTIGNFPVAAADPAAPSNGDVWLKDTGGVRTLNARIGGVTYSTTLT